MSAATDIKKFKKTLKDLGFTQVRGIQLSYEHPDKGWYAEIQDRGKWADVWMIGRGLRSSASPPGGSIYSSPDDIINECADN